MRQPLTPFSVRLSRDTHDHLSLVAAARRERPADLARSWIEEGLRRVEQLNHEETKPTKEQERDSELATRLTRAAIFAELMLTQFGHEDPANTQRMLRQAEEEAATLLGQTLPSTPEPSEPSKPFSSEPSEGDLVAKQRAVAARLAAG